MSQFNVLLKIYQLCSVTHQRTRQCQDLGKMAACSKAGLHYPWWGGQIASNRDVWWPHSYPPQSALPVQRPASSPVQQSPRASPPGSPMASGQRPSPPSCRPHQPEPSSCCRQFPGQRQPWWLPVWPAGSRGGWSTHRNHVYSAATALPASFSFSNCCDWINK